MRLCRVVTVPLTFATLLRGQLGVIASNDVDLTIISSPGEDLDSIAREYCLHAHPIAMTRGISPLRDILSLVALVKFFLLHRFDIVHSSTPKAGFLTALAAWLTRVPIRLHTYTGQVWVEMSGFPRLLARLSDQIIARFATHCYADSFSQRAFLIEEGIVAARKISVVGHGSISGVDLHRFSPDKWTADRSSVRKQLGIGIDSSVIVFVGRVTRDKGIVELVTAFTRLHSLTEPVDLVLVGPYEPERDPIPGATLEKIDHHPHIHAVGFTHEPERYLSIADLFCLPSFREGFGSVVIEAAAMGIPAVVTSIVGAKDTVLDGKTGLLVPVRDEEALGEALSRLLSDSGLRRRMGRAARQRAIEQFDAMYVNQAVVNEYSRQFQRCRGWKSETAGTESFP